MLDLAARRYARKKINGFRRVLDFACGSGRVMQYIGDGPKLYGCDIAAPLVSFAKNVCTRATVFTNDFEPPLDIREGLFDLVYAFSVFSHLAEDLEMRWLQELHRVGAPDCLYLLTVHGDWVIEATLGEERARAEAAGFYFRYVCSRDGSELDFPVGYEASYHTSDYIRRRWSELFEVRAIIKGDDPSNYLWGDVKFAPEGEVQRFRAMGQDLVVLWKR
jgi:SAM-dependent methyltransferase